MPCVPSPAHGRHLSFKKAAEELFVTRRRPGEDPRGLPRRRSSAAWTRALELTVPGAAMLPRVGRGPRLLRGQVCRRAGRRSATIAVSAPPTSCRAGWCRDSAVHEQLPAVRPAHHRHAQGHRQPRAGRARRARPPDAEAHVAVRYGTGEYLETWSTWFPSARPTCRCSPKLLARAAGCASRRTCDSRRSSADDSSPDDVRSGPAGRSGCASPA